ncbi:hypothetical protein [Caproicibacter sp.]|uniref:hypothetical protein n=1 Tax=Caproicibacter sp. TaxID=2814884 RepID=UPI003988F691
MTASDLTYTTTDTGYTILLNGKPWIVQDGDNPYFPYAGDTMANKAQTHIAAILAEQQAAEEAKGQPTIEDRVSALEAAQVAALGV